MDSIIRPIYTKPKKRKIYCYKKANWEALNTDCAALIDIIKTKFEAGECVEKLWDIFKSGLNKAIEKHIPMDQ